MNVKVKRCLEFFAVVIITGVIALTSPFNPWGHSVFTDVQNEILDIAHSVRDGYLAYVELDGHYGPVVYEFFGLGFLLTDTHLVQFIMETIINFISVLFLYKTAKLYTSEFFAIVSAAIIAVFEWGQLTHAGAEEILFFITSLTCYHIARQLKSGILSHHAYLIAIDLGLVFFLQPGYVFFWIVVVVFFAIKFKFDGSDSKDYKTFWFSIIEGLITVSIPMGLYLWYFKNAAAFWQNVVIYNMNNLGTFADGLRILCTTPWALLVPALVVVIVIKILISDRVVDLCCWLGIIIIGIIVIAIQGDNLQSYIEISKALYIVPLASIFSLIDRPLGLKAEQRF